MALPILLFWFAVGAFVVGLILLIIGFKKAPRIGGLATPSFWQSIGLFFTWVFREMSKLIKIISGPNVPRDQGYRAAGLMAWLMALLLVVFALIAQRPNDSDPEPTQSPAITATITPTPTAT